MIFQKLFKIKFLLLLIVAELIHAAELFIPPGVRCIEENEFDVLLPFNNEQEKKYEDFLQVIKDGDFQKVVSLLPDIDINYITKRKDTALCCAAYHQQKKIVELLLKKGANPSIELNLAPFWAISEENLEILDLLLSYGADLNIKDRHGFTILKHAMHARNIEAFKLILKYGPDPDVKDNGGVTVLSYARHYRWQEYVELMDIYIEQYKKYYPEYAKIKAEINLNSVTASLLGCTDIPKELCKIIAQYTVQTFHEFVQFKLKEEEYNLKQQEEINEQEKLIQQDDEHKSKRCCVIS